MVWCGHSKTQSVCGKGDSIHAGPTVGALVGPASHAGSPSSPALPATRADLSLAAAWPGLPLQEDGEEEAALTLDEVQVIQGALDMASKTAESAMTPIDKVGAPRYRQPFDLLCCAVRVTVAVPEVAAPLASAPSC